MVSTFDRSSRLPFLYQWELLRIDRPYPSYRGMFCWVVFSGGLFCVLGLLRRNIQRIFFAIVCSLCFGPVSGKHWPDLLHRMPGRILLFHNWSDGTEWRLQRGQLLGTVVFDVSQLHSWPIRVHCWAGGLHGLSGR